jgi:hypothetical protein
MAVVSAVKAPRLLADCWLRMSLTMRLFKADSRRWLGTSLWERSRRGARASAP